MRKLILITALLLASASAQAADQNRGLILASNDEPQTSEKIDAVKPADTAKPAETAKPETTTPEVKAEAPKPDTAKPQAAKPVKHVRHEEGDEAKARRIAARYGVYW
jgi:outer membrane biosynthesis protein TonB